MATLTHAESRRLYSWWWDSHISPKNSKWLQENLTDMDIKVKAMIKLLEEDADSFRRRAEMYYRKRPELLKLVEEFYRAYRALAERYDHATGALRQAQRSMAEAFPNQIPFVLSDESPSGSSVEADHRTPETLPSVRAFFDSDDSQKDALHALKRNGEFSEGNDSSTPKKGLRISETGEEAAHANFSDGRAKKNLNFLEEEANGAKYKVLQEEVSQLSSENKNLKNQITSESKRADAAETVVESLKDSLSKLESEKEASSVQYRLSQEMMSDLEAEVSRIKKLNDEMLTEISELKTVKERCLLLEKENESLQSELDAIKQATKMQLEELEIKQEELMKLNISIQNERQRSAQAEVERLSFEKLHSQSQEEARLLALEIQDVLEKLKNMELSKEALEEEIKQLKEENVSLNERSSSFALMIVSLQKEINILKEVKRKLEGESGLHLEEKRVRQKEISSLRADKKDLERKHYVLMEQIGALNLKVESLEALVKELRDGNIELKAICVKHEDGRVHYLEKMKEMEKISETNAALENSLSDAMVELEELREKIKTLEESCESLDHKNSIHTSEKAALVSQVEAIAQSMENLSEKNMLLENSLSDVNAELEGLRGKFKVLEESRQSLYDEKANLLSEKNILAYQVESISLNLENSERRYVDLEGRNLNLEREKELILDRITNLQSAFELEKAAHETLMQSSKSQLATLENQLHVIQGEHQLQKELFEMEQHKIMNAEFEVFILRRCLCDMKENNLTLSDKCRGYLDTSRCTEKLMSELDQKIIVQKEKLASLSHHNEKLMEGIHLIAKILGISNDCRISDDLLVEHILHEIGDLQTSISVSQDNNQRQVLEKLVILSLLKQFGLDVENLKSEKIVLEKEYKIKREQLSTMQSEKRKLLEINGQLVQNVQTCNQREETLKTDVDLLSRQLSDFRDTHSTLQSEISKLLDENNFLSKKFDNLKEKKDKLEEENSVILVEAMTMEYLYLIFRSYDAERTSELQALSNEMDCVCGVRNELDQGIRLMNEKLGALEVENTDLMKSVADLEECRRRLVILEDDVNTARNITEQLNIQIEAGHNLLLQREAELLEANQNIEATRDKNSALSNKLDGTKVMQAELEQKIFTLTKDNAHMSNEISRLRQCNDALNGELVNLREEVGVLKIREDYLISELQKSTDEIKSCGVEIAALLNDIQMKTINAAIFEDKMLDLLLRCESLEIVAIVQRQMLGEEISRRHAYENKLKDRVDALEGEKRNLEKELSACIPLVLSLLDDFLSLEEHTLSLAAKHPAVNNQEKQVSPLVPPPHNKNCQDQSEDLSAMVRAGNLKLQELHAKVNALEKVVIDTEGQLNQERHASNASLEAAMMEIETLKSNGSASHEETQISEDIVLHLIKSEGPGKLQKSDSQTCGEKVEERMKDIQLDHVSSTSPYENGTSPHALSAKDQMLELWETERQHRNKIQKASSVTSEHDSEYHEITAIEEEKSEYPSKRVIEKELSIDKLELPRILTGSRREWSGSVTERLSSDAQRLSVLQKSAKELKRKIETSDLNNSPTGFEFDTVKARWKEAEGAILQLIDINSRLKQKAEDFSSSTNSLISEENDALTNTSDGKISSRARRGSEKIGRLELELQKIEYILLKLEEENDIKKARAADRRTRVLLRDYLYGRRESPRRKKFHCCACMRPRTKGD